MPDAPGGWKTLAPSAMPHAEGEDVPRQLDEGGLLKIKNDFVLAAQRAERLGLEGIADSHGAWLFAAPIPVTALQYPH